MNWNGRDQSAGLSRCHVTRAAPVVDRVWDDTLNGHFIIAAQMGFTEIFGEIVCIFKKKYRFVEETPL